MITGGIGNIASGEEVKRSDADAMVRRCEMLVVVSLWRGS